MTEEMDDLDKEKVQDDLDRDSDEGITEDVVRPEEDDEDDDFEKGETDTIDEDEDDDE